MDALVLRGTPPDGSGSGNGSGYGYGDGSGYGYGYGYGYGDGSGYGYGYGNGSGYGYGYGSGYGYGYGSGYGNGYGSGNGNGDGDGYGSGYSNGDGSGYGSGEYWLATIQYFAARWTEAQRNRLAALRALGTKIAFWRSDAKGLAANGGGRIAAAAPGVIHESAGPLMACHAGTLHATLIPPKWSGERVWVVALHGEIVGDDEKFGCLKREIIGEAI